MADTDRLAKKITDTEKLDEADIKYGKMLKNQVKVFRKATNRTTPHPSLAANPSKKIDKILSIDSHWIIMSPHNRFRKTQAVGLLGSIISSYHLHNVYFDYSPVYSLHIQKRFIRLTLITSNQLVTTQLLHRKLYELHVV